MALSGEADDALLTGLTDLALALRYAGIAPGKTNTESLRSALETLVSERSLGEEADRVRFGPDGLVTPLVYAVANHVPLTRSSAEFGFQRTVAAVARRDLFRRPISRPSDAAPREARGALECSLGFFGESGLPDADDSVSALWTERWREYAALTESHELQGFPTWNQLLLGHVARPHVMGAAWRWPSEATPPSYYTLVDESLLLELGLPSLVSVDGWPELLWNASLSPSATSADAHREIERLVARCKRMEPRLPFTVQQARWALYQLIRSFALWGGTCFVSIPIAFGGTTLTEATSVLSLCTTRPLSEREILQWRSIGREMFQPLIARESETVIRQEVANRRYVHSTYGIGHALKNRVMPLRRQLDEALQLTDSHQVTQSLLVAEQVATSIRDFGHLLNFFGQFRRAGRLGMRALSKDVVLSEDLMLGSRLSQLLATLTPTLGARTQAKVVPRSDLSRLGGLAIRPFIQSDRLGVPVRPIDEFYDEILYELFVNAANYGPLAYGANGAHEVAVSVEVTDELDLIIANEFQANRKTGRFPRIAKDEWIDWPNDTSDGGGLYYAALALGMTETGRIALRVSERGGQGVFSVRLTLAGVHRT